MKSNLTSINEINTLRRWVRITCETQNMEVQFIDTSMPYTRERAIFIPRFNSNMTHDDVKRIRFYVLHECSHHNGGNKAYFDVMKRHGLRIQHPLGAISNILEDQRIERGASSKYEGDAYTIEDGRTLLCEDSLATWTDIAKRVKPEDMADHSCYMQAVYGAASISQSGWCPGISSLVRKEMDLCCDTFPLIKSSLEKLIGIDVISKINSLRTPEESYELGREIYKLLWNKTDEEVDQELEQMKQQAQGDGNQEGQGDGDKDDGSGSGDAQSTGASGDDADDGDETMGGSVDPRTGKYTIPVEQFVKSDHGQMKEGQHGHGLGLDYTNYKSRTVYETEDFARMDVREFTAGQPIKSMNNITDWANIQNNDLRSSPHFANRVRKFLQVKTEDGYIGGMKRGSVNTRALYRAGMPQIADGDWNKKVFRVRDENELLDTSVSLVVDMSGSMAGPKIVHATRAAMTLNNVISNVLRVNTEILTFSWERKSIIGVIKPFGTRASDDDILARFNKMADKMWGNNDADSIAFAYDRLKKQETKRKVMVVLSDGSPADGIGDTDPFYALKYVVNQIEEDKKCDIIGIGIMDSSVNQFYSRRVVIPNSACLEEKLLEVITSNIIGG